MTAIDYGKIAAARALIADPDHWTQDVYARNAAGLSVYEGSKEAVSFCMMGAIERVGIPSSSPETAAIASALPSGSGGSIPGFNDNRKTTHRDVLKVFDRAIARQHPIHVRLYRAIMGACS